jgi:hypothetical protein
MIALPTGSPEVISSSNDAKIKLPGGDGGYFDNGFHYSRYHAHSPEKRMTDGNFGQISEACRTSVGVEKWNSKVPS